MDRYDVDWQGYWAATPTPFRRDGELDEGAFREVLRLYLAQGIDGVLVNGTTGEWYAQSEGERRRVAEIAVDELGGKMTVVIGCTAFTAAQVSELAQHARSVGADGALSTPPPYAAPNHDEIVHFFQTISDSVDLPLMVYNWPRGTSVDLPPEVAVKLAAIPNVVAIKDSTPNQVQLYATLEAVVDKVRVFGNFINQPGIGVLRTMGGDGYIGGGALLGAELPEFFRAVRQDDLLRAREIARKSTVFYGRLSNPDWSGKYGSPQSWLKAAMNLLGQPGGYPRPPLLPVEAPAQLQAIAAALEEAGLRVHQPAGAATRGSS